MRQTYQLMSRLMLKELEPLTNEALAEKYQQTKDERILATAYVKNIRLFTKLCKKYSWVDDEDKATAVLTSLENSMRGFSADCKTKFGTYLYKSTSRALMRATDTMLHKGRDRRLYDVSLDTPYTSKKSPDGSGVRISDMICDSTNNWDSVDIAIDCEKSKTLTFKEKQFCKICLSMSNPTSKVLREELKLNSIELFKLRKSLKQKILKEMEM